MQTPLSAPLLDDSFQPTPSKTLKQHYYRYIPHAVLLSLLFGACVLYSAPHFSTLTNNAATSVLQPVEESQSLNLLQQVPVATNLVETVFFAPALATQLNAKFPKCRKAAYSGVVADKLFVYAGAHKHTRKYVGRSLNDLWQWSPVSGWAQAGRRNRGRF